MSIAKTMPEIVIEAMETDCGSIRLFSFPGTLDPLEAGVKVIAGEYDVNSRELMQIWQGTSSGPVLMKGREAIMTSWKIKHFGELTAIENHWLFHDPQQKSWELSLREKRMKAGEWYIEETRINAPAMITPGEKEKKEDRYDRGAREAVDAFIFEVDGVFKVVYGAESCQAIRMRYCLDGQDMREVHEYFDLESGRVVLQQLFDGAAVSRCRVASHSEEIKA